MTGAAEKTVERFTDRQEAGQELAEAVEKALDGEEVIVLALPRGGVPVAAEVADRLGAPLDVLLVRKLGVPWQPEMAFGAIATGDILATNDDHVKALGLKQDLIHDIVERERAELDRREQLYRDGRPPIDIAGKTVVVVDDGIATGSTVRAALKTLERRGVKKRVVACPVAAAETVRALEKLADQVICLRTPKAPFGAVGTWYEDFAPVFDSEVKKLLDGYSASE
ncbi:MAG: phosphoribosyltransferase [Gemmatimonadota bacterium]